MKIGVFWFLSLLAAQALAAEPAGTPLDSRQRAAQLLVEMDEPLFDAGLLQPPLPAGTASADLQPMFSAQGGSWPFEPFVHNGLFRVIAGYQPGHPKALVLRQGTIDIDRLHRTLQKPHVLRPHKDGYLLSFPLLIGPDAALVIEGKTLYLATHSGAALINQGTLKLKHAVVQSWLGGSAPNNTPFRPFIISWAGSSTHIEHSHLHRLGFNAHLSRGLTLARASVQKQAAPPRLLLRDNLIDSLASGLELHDSHALVESNRFADLQQYGMDLRDSRVELRANRVDRVRNHAGIRLRGKTDGLLSDNLILRTGKAGLEVLDHHGHLRAHGNHIAQAGSNGIQLRGISAAAKTELVIADNLIVDSGYSGIEGFGVGQLWMINNRIQGAPEYAVSLRNPPGSRSRIELHGNQLAKIRKSPLRVEGLGQLRLAGNRFVLAPLQAALAGELVPVQSHILLAADNPHCTVEVTPGQPGEYPAVRSVDCTPL